MAESIRIQHPSESAAQNVFAVNQSADSLRPLCIEAETNIPPGSGNRSSLMVDQVVNRVYGEASAWMTGKHISKRISYSKNTVDHAITTQLAETQKANYVFRNLMEIFHDSEHIGGFKDLKFNNAGAMYGYFKEKRLLTIHMQEESIDHLKTLLSIPKPAQLSLQGCGISALEPSWLHDKLTVLDLSSNRLTNIDSIPFPDTLERLDLSYNQFESAPTKLGSGITEFSLRGNPIKKLGAFSGLDKLKWLDISYMGVDNEPVEIEPSFWNTISAGTALVISPGMRFTVPENARGKVVFISAVDNKIQAKMDENGYVELKLLKTQEQRKTPRIGFWTSLMGLCITAALAFIGYLGFRAWSRAKA